MIMPQKLFNVFALVLLGAASLAFAPLNTGVAQSSLGHLEDASTPPRGLLRLRAATVWTRFDSRFITGGEAPLGSFLSSDSLGAAQLPSLAPLEADIESASQLPFSLSMGRSRLDATAREEIVPIVFEYGLTSRLALTAMLPVVRRRVMPQFQLDTAGGFVANVGPNPHRTSTLAASTNAQVQQQFASAASALQTLLTQCAGNPAQPQCASVNGRESAANALIQDSQRFASDVGNIYGTSAATGSPFVPMTGSAAQTAIAGRIATFNTEYKDFLGSSTDRLTQNPVGAGGPAGVTDLQHYLTQDLGRDSLVLREKVYVGDWELGAKFRAVDVVATPTRRLATQLALAGAIRFPSGTRHSGSQIVDLSTGTGRLAFTSRAILDAKYARFGVLATAYGAFAVGDADTLAQPDTRWTEIHVAPRWHFSDPFSIHGAYSLRSANATGGDQLVGGGFTFNTIDRWAGGKLPIEMRYTHLEAVSGDAGRPRFFREQLELRLYYRLLRR